VATIFYEHDANPSALKGKTIAIFGYGSQGHAQAQNLRDSGYNVIVGLDPQRPSAQQAKADGMTVLRPAEAAKRADWIQILTPDETQGDFYESQIKPALHAGKIFGVSHGFSIHFKTIVPPKDVDVVMIAPKSPGHLLRRVYTEGRGVPSLLAIHQDASGRAHEYALCYAYGIGSTRAGVLQTTFKEETESDLFGEQAVLCGGLTSLIKKGFETLVEAGRGVPSLLAIHQDASGRAHEYALCYAYGIGSTRAGVLQTTFKEETESDLFGEQAVLCGGLTSLIKKGFETLVEAGYAPEIAYFECLHEMKLIVDLIYEGGLGRMRYSISNTAEYGDLTRGEKVVGDETRKAMKEILARIQDGSFAKEWVEENKKGGKNFAALREKEKQHQIEQVGAKLRGMMSWLQRDTKKPGLAQKPEAKVVNA